VVSNLRVGGGRAGCGLLGVQPLRVGGSVVRLILGWGVGLHRPVGGDVGAPGAHRSEVVVGGVVLLDEDHHVTHCHCHPPGLPASRPLIKETLGDHQFDAAYKRRFTDDRFAPLLPESSCTVCQWLTVRLLFGGA
jgi:hypothetical protein